MHSFAITALDNCGFRLTLDLSAWAAVGVSLAGAVLRCQVKPQGVVETTPATIEFATGGANPFSFDPATSLAVLSAPAAAVVGLAGTYGLDARAEFPAAAIPLFSGTLRIRPAVTQGASGGSLPGGDTAWIAAHPFGPAPVPAPIAAAVANAQSAAAAALTRSFIYGWF